MKTLIHTTALLAIIAVVFTSKSFASEINPTNFAFEEETYIDDIPFNTASVVASYKYEQAVSVVFVMADEAYINDITINTEIVAEAYAYQKTISTEFQFDDEAYIDDIPFCTYAIAGSNSGDNRLFVSIP